MDISPLPGILPVPGGIFAFAGAALIVYGGIKAAVRILLLEFRRRDYQYNKIRNEFTSRIVFGLEFLIAADILRTLVTPSHGGNAGFFVRNIFPRIPVNCKIVPSPGKTFLISERRNCCYKMAQSEIEG